MLKNRMLALGALLLTAVFILNAVLVISVTPAITASVTDNSPVNDHGRYYGVDDPVLQKIKDMKSKGMDNSSVTSELKKQHMFWDPRTGDHGIGTLFTPEENAIMQSYRPHISTTTSDGTVGLLTTLTGTQANVLYKSNSATYEGVKGNMIPGSLAISAYGTSSHCITSHMGYDNGGSNYDWIELGIRRDVLAGGVLAPHTIFTYWGKGGSGAWYNPPGFSVGPSTVIQYRMERSGPYDFYYHGYPYDFYVNNQWVRRVYMNSALCIVDWSNEIWRPNEQTSYTTDSTTAQVYSTYAQRSTDHSWVAWDIYFADTFYRAPIPCPMTSNKVTDPGLLWHWNSYTSN